MLSDRITHRPPSWNVVIIVWQDQNSAKFLNFFGFNYKGASSTTLPSAKSFYLDFIGFSINLAKHGVGVSQEEILDVLPKLRNFSYNLFFRRRIQNLFREYFLNWCIYLTPLRRSRLARRRCCNSQTQGMPERYFAIRNVFELPQLIHKKLPFKLYCYCLHVQIFFILIRLDGGNTKKVQNTKSSTNFTWKPLNIFIFWENVFVHALILCLF